MVYCMKDDGKQANVPDAADNLDNAEALEEHYAATPRSDNCFVVHLDLHNSDYDFSPLVPVYGSGFCGKITEIWQEAFGHERKASTRKWFNSLNRALLAIASLGEDNPQSPAGQVYLHLRDRPNVPTDAKTFFAAIHSVVSRVEDLNDDTIVNSPKRKTRRNFVSNLSSVVRRLATHRLFPSIGPIKCNLASNPFEPKLPCLAELTRTGRSSVPVSGTRALSLGEHVVAMLDLNIERLSSLRACLEREFVDEYRAFKLGQTWVARAGMPDAETVASAIAAASQILSPRSPGRHRRKYKRLLPGTFIGRLKSQLGAADDNELKAIVVRYFHSRFPLGWHTNRLPEPYRVLLAYIGSHEIVRHLEANARATTAAFGILLIDTAFNVASLEDLPADPFVGSARHGKRRVSTIAARKMRARGKRVEGTLCSTGPIVGQEAELPLCIPEGNISGVEVIECYLEMTEPLRERAKRQGNSEVARKLWVVSRGRSANGGQVTNSLTTMGNTWWPAFLKRNASDPVIGGLRITRQHIRCTVLQIRSARNGFGHAIAQAVADHSHDSTTVSYLGAGWFRAQLERQIRAFQDVFEAALSRGVEGAYKKLGIDAQEFARRVELANEVGLDFTCSQKSENMDASVAPRPSCTPMDPCDICPSRQFIPNDENFRLLHLAHKALKQAEPTFIAQNPRRWLLVWFCWRALTEAYVRKIRRSPHKIRYERVTQTADAELTHGQIVLPIIF
jgi:hypothetical protein